MSSSIVFDFDGVLADTGELLLSIFQNINSDISLEDFLAHHEGNIYLEPKIQFSKWEMDRVYREYWKWLNTTLSLSATSIVDSIREDIHLFIVSSNDAVAIELFLSELGIKDRFTKVLWYQHGKSKSSKLQSLINDFNIDVKTSLFITDTLGDLREISKFGILKIAVLYGFHDKETLQRWSPDSFVRIPAELQKILSVL